MSAVAGLMHIEWYLDELKDFNDRVRLLTDMLLSNHLIELNALATSLEERIEKRSSKALRETHRQLDQIIFDYKRILAMDPEEFFADFELETGQRFGPEYIEDYEET